MRAETLFTGVSYSGLYGELAPLMSGFDSLFLHFRMAQLEAQ